MMHETTNIKLKESGLVSFWFW